MSALPSYDFHMTTDFAGERREAAAMAEQAAYEAWCEARSHCDEVDAMRDFMLQHKRVTGVLSGETPVYRRIATVHTDTFAEWTAWDMRVNFRTREKQA